MTLNLGASSGTINGSSQPIVVSIYNETIGTAYRNQVGPTYVTSANVPQPGSQVAGGLLTPVNPRPTVAGAYDFTGSVALAANTSYWIVVTSADTSGAYNWLYDNNDGPATSSSGWSVRALNSNSAMNLVDTTRQGINIWDNFDGFNYLFSITTGVAATTITSLNRASTNPSNASTVNYTLTFASAVTGVTASNFSLSGAAATGASVGTPTIASGGGLTWTVPVTTGSTDGTLTLSVANSTNFSPTVSTTLPFTSAGQSYTMDKTKPTATIGAPSVSTIAAGAGSVTYAVTYADTNFASSSLTTGGITLNTTGTASGTVGLTGSGTSYTVTISSITGVGSIGITVAAGTSLDTANNANLVSAASTTFAVTPAAPTVTLAHTAVNANVTSITFAGTGFDTTASNNTVTFVPGTTTGVVSSATSTSMTVTVSNLKGGLLAATVINGNGSSGIHTVVADVKPVVTSSTTNLATTATSLTISGVGFDSSASNNTVAFSPSGTGTVTAATSTSLTVSSITGLTAGALNAVVTTNAQASASTQVATVTTPTTITSLNRVNATPSNGAFVSWTLTFASPVLGLSASNFTLTGAAAAGSSVISPGTSNGGLTWNVAVATGSTDGTLTLSLTNATGLSQAISTSLPFTTAGQDYTMDKTAPTIVSIVRQSPTGQNTGSTSVTFRVTYSEAVTGMTNSSFTVVPVSSTIVGTVTGVNVVNPTTCDVTVNITSGTGEFRLRGVN